VTLVIDASVAIQWVLPESGSAIAASLRSERLIAPALWLIEAANAIWKRQQRGEMSIGQAGVRLAELASAPIASLLVEPYIASALQLGAALNHPVYDCLYLAVAIHHETHVVTADRRFAALGDRPGMSGRVRLLGS
jgi:predicted nucleic acid-binding protein